MISMVTLNGTTDCEDCKRLRRGLTWYGEPPKCRKHSDAIESYIE